jgi:hypothetical protein
VFSGIVYHANYLRFMARGRTNHLRLMGAEHTLFAEAETETMTLDFLRPAARMDDVLDVVTWPACGEGRFNRARTGGAARRRGSGQGRGARGLHQRRPGAADSEIDPRLDENRFDLVIGRYEFGHRLVASRR